MRLRQVEYGALIVIWLWVFTSPAWSAQQPAAAPPQAAAPPAETAPKVIAVTEVIPSSEQALIQLHEIRKELEADTSVSVVDAGLPVFTDQLNQWWQGEADTIQQLGSMQRMNDVLWQLRLYEGQIETWNALLAASSKKWSAEKEGMGGLIASWKATQLALDSTAPDGIANKVGEVLLEGDFVQQLFQEKTAQLVAAQGRLAATLKRVQEIRLDVDSVNLQPAGNLLSFNNPPLWRALFAAGPGRSTSAQIGDGIVKLYNDGLRFFQMYRDRLFLHLVLFLVLLALFLRLRQISRRPSTVTPSVAERFVLDRSLASALLVALFSVPLLYSDASPQMVRMILFPAVIPLLMLLPAVFPRQLRRALYVLTAVYAMDFWRYYLPPQGIMVRLLLLAEALVGIGVIYRLQRGKLFESERLKPRENTARTMLKIGTGLFLGAIIANLLGAMSLAEVLFSPLVRTLYMGVVIRMMTVVATTFAMMALRSPLALMLRTVQESGEAVAANIRKLANFAAVSLWVVIGLFNIGVFGFLVSLIEEIFDAKWNLGAIEISVREVVMFVLVFGFAYALSRSLRFILAKEIFPRFQMPRGVPDVLDLLARYGVLLFGFLIAMVSAGVNLSQMTIALSAFGVGIGFGLQNIVNNFVCGLILVFEHPIQVGDFVEVGQHSGRVERIGFRSSSVSTGDGGTVIIPNSELIGSKVMNWSLSDQLRRVTLRVPVPVDTDPKTVIDMFQAIASSNEEVESYPAPSAALDRFSDGSLMFMLRCWTRVERHEAVSQSLTLEINRAFGEAGIQIPFAQSDVHLHWQEKAGSEIQSLEKLNQAAAGGVGPKKSTVAS
jgi:small-conductance mechanosensitive channel